MVAFSSNNRGNRRARKSVMEDDRRARIAALKVKGLSVRQIQARFELDGVFNPLTGRAWSIGVISEDMSAIDARWKAETIRDWGEWKRIELEKIDQIEKEAQTAWDRGIGKKQKTIQEKTTGGREGGGTKASVVTEDLNGDPRYLSVMLDCQKRRAQLIGFDAAMKTEHSGPGGGAIEITDSERALKLEALLEKVACRGAGCGEDTKILR
jgi:hypothetical protein